MHKIFFIAVSILFCCTSITAQDSNYPDSVVSEEGVATIEEDDADEFYDTTINFFPLNISYDSVAALKNHDAFAYGKYLDSLLKQRQKERASQQEKRKADQSKSSSSNVTFSSPDSFFASSGSKIILWVLAGAFILFVIYKLFLGDGIFRKNTPSVVAAPGKEEEITAESDMDALISSAVRNKNYRLAVRYWYLKSLKHLSERGLLQLSVDKTNYQYVNEIKNTAQRNDFASLTLNYEYVWYGEFEVDHVLYQRLENNFSSFVKKV